LAYQDRKETKDFQALLDYLDLVVQREIEVLMVHLDCLELQDCEENQAL